MTGPEHYAAAELLIEAATESGDLVVAEHLARLAQVRATLALAAATAQVADDDDRIAGCVPDGGSSLSVAVAGR
jgi:hypothetical protein